VSKLVLHAERFWISPYVFSCFVALREKQLEFDVRDVALDRGEQRSPDFRSRSITSRVPMLEDGDFALAESQAIIDYLEDAYPAHSILPRSIHERARARQVLAWIRSDLDALRADRPTTTMFYDATSVPLSDKGRAAADKLIAVAERLLTSAEPQIFGTWSIADADLAFMLQRLLLNGQDVPAKLRTFAETQWKRPSIAEFVAHRRPPYVAYVV
jgi:glutathione S-transferase